MYKKVVIFLFISLVLTASIEAVSYRVGGYTYETEGRVLNGDPTYTKLFDGIKDSGNKPVLNIDFWGVPQDRAYLDIIWDFKFPVLIQYGKIYGKNHSASYSCGEIEFFIADEDGNRILASKKAGSDNLLWSVKSDLIGLYGRYLIFRVWKGNASRVNIEEIEADFIVFPNPPQNLTAKRTTLSEVELRWQPSPPAACGKGAEFYRIYRTDAPDSEPTAPPLLETANTYCSVNIGSSTAYIAVYAVDFEGNESLTAARAVLPAVGYVEGQVISDGEPLAGVVVESGELAAITDPNGQFKLEPIPAGLCNVVAHLAGFIAQSLQVEVSEGEPANVLIQMSKGNLATSPPEEPQAFRLGVNSVQLNWFPPQDGNAFAFKVYRAKKPVFSEADFLARIYTTSWQDRGLEHGEYFYFITSVSITDHESLPTAPLPVLIPELKAPILLSPTHGSVLIGNSALPGFVNELTWQGNDECIGYQVVIDGPGGPWAEEVSTESYPIPQEILAAHNTWFTWQVGAIYDHETEPVFSKPQRFMVSNFTAEEPFTISEVGISKNPYKPAEGSAVFTFSLSENADITWELYNLSGWLVNTKRFSGQ